MKQNHYLTSVNPCSVFRMEAVWTQVPRSLLQCYLLAYILSKQAYFRVCSCVHTCVCVRFPPQSSMPCDHKFLLRNSHVLLLSHPTAWPNHRTPCRSLTERVCVVVSAGLMAPTSELLWNHSQESLAADTQWQPFPLFCCAASPNLYSRG